jgi:hypothetical protein
MKLVRGKNNMKPAVHTVLPILINGKYETTVLTVLPLKICGF